MTSMMRSVSRITRNGVLYSVSPKWKRHPLISSKTVRYIQSIFRLFALILTLFICSPQTTLADNPPIMADLEMKSLLLQQLHHFAGLESIEYTETIGKVEEGEFMRTAWRQMGNKYFFKYLNQSKERSLPWELTVSYDGERAYKYVPEADMLFTQSTPFLEANRYIQSLRGPLMAFEFAGTKDVHIGLDSLKSTEFLSSVVPRCTFVPDKNRSWGDHNSIAVKVVDGYNRWTRESVDFIVYFAPDLGLFPIAWEMFNEQDQIVLSFWVDQMEKIKFPGSDTVVNFPKSALFRNNRTARSLDLKITPLSEGAPITGIDERLNYPDLRLNMLSEDDFVIDPSTVNRIFDFNAKTLITVPK